MSVCDPLNTSVVGGKSYSDSVRSFPKDNIFACKNLVKQKVSGGQEQEQVFEAMEFTVQVSTFLLN